MSLNQKEKHSYANGYSYPNKAFNNVCKIYPALFGWCWNIADSTQDYNVCLKTGIIWQVKCVAYFKRFSYTTRYFILVKVFVALRP